MTEDENAKQVAEVHRKALGVVMEEMQDKRVDLVMAGLASAASAFCLASGDNRGAAFKDAFDQFYGIQKSHVSNLGRVTPDSS